MTALPKPFEEEDPEFGKLMLGWVTHRLFRGTPLYITPNGVLNAVTKKTISVCLHRWPNTPRNAPCPCGSGRKFKKCAL